MDMEGISTISHTRENLSCHSKSWTPLQLYSEISVMSLYWCQSLNELSLTVLFKLK